MNKKLISLYIPGKMGEKIQELAKKNKRSVNNMLNLLLENIPELQDKEIVSVDEWDGELEDGGEEYDLEKPIKLSDEYQKKVEDIEGPVSDEGVS